MCSTGCVFPWSSCCTPCWPIPAPHQHLVLARVVAAATVVVTMTETARTRLIAGWDIDGDKVTVIAHGADDNRADIAGITATKRPTILTWGLLGEGKGIEWALEAMAGLADLTPLPLYRVVGETHPRVVEREGQAYRGRLLAQVDALGISSMVEFDGRYLDAASLQRIVGEADVVLLPYDSRDQVTSGVLTEAVVAGKPVVSTRFPHAVELLEYGRRNPCSATGSGRHRRGAALGAHRARPGRSDGGDGTRAGPGAAVVGGRRGVHGPRPLAARYAEAGHCQAVRGVRPPEPCASTTCPR